MRRRPKTYTRPSMIYFAKDPATGLIKIGCTSNWERRHRALAHAHGHRLEPIGFLSGSRLSERRIHERLAEFRIHGEWFLDVPAVHDLLWEVDSGKDATGRYGGRL